MLATPRVLAFPARPKPIVNAADQGALMAAAQGGDAGAYRVLLQQLRPWLQGYFRRRLPPDLVEDAVQETLSAIHAKRHTYQPDRPIGPWIAAIARYKWIDRLREMKRTRTVELPDDVAIEDHGSAVTSATLLGRLLAQLRPAQADAIRLVKIDGLSVEEASTRTGQSASLVKVNIHRGLARLTRIVQDRDHDD